MRSEQRDALTPRWLRLTIVRRGWQRVVARPALVAVVAALVVGTSGAIVFASGALDVRHVDVVGASRTTAVRIDTVARSVVGDAMLTVNTSLLRRRVAALPEVAAVHVSREWPSTLRVTISERRAVFGVQQRGEWLLVDSVATPYLTVARLPAHVLPLTVDEPTAGDLTLRAAVDVVAALPAAVRKNVVAVSAPSIAGIRLRLHDGSTVIWGGPQDSSRKARALAVLLRQPAAGNGLVRGHGHAHVYDVSTPGFVTLS